jgi:hypothetical protein
LPWYYIGSGEGGGAGTTLILLFPIFRDNIYSAEENSWLSLFIRIQQGGSRQGGCSCIEDLLVCFSERLFLDALQEGILRRSSVGLFLDALQEGCSWMLPREAVHTSTLFRASVSGCSLGRLYMNALQGGCSWMLPREAVHQRSSGRLFLDAP